MNKPIYEQIEEYLNYCRARQFTEQTMDTKVRVLNKFAELEIVDDMQKLTNRDINRWMAMQSSGAATGNVVSGRTINSRLSHIIAFLKYLRDMDYDISVKIRLIEPAKEKPPRRNWFTRDQVEKVIENAEPMTRLLISPAYDDGRPYSIDELRYKMRREFEKVGIDGFYLHALRHSFATDIQKRGASISQAQRLLRHSNSATTEVYLHALDSGMINVYDRLKIGAIA